MAKIINLSPNSSGRRHTIAVPVAERTHPLTSPKKLTVAQRKVWDRYIEPAKWLQEADTALAYVFVCIMARYLKDAEEVTAAELSQMRLIAGDLGLRPAERQRLSKPKDNADPASEFFR